MKGIILHGGHGTRLRPLTHTGPKQLLPIANKPMSQYALEDLKNVGIHDIVIILGDIYPEKVKEYYGNGEEFGVNITYIYQEKPKGISHAIRLCKEFVGNDKFIVYLGDNVLRKDLTDYTKKFSSSDLDAMILLCAVDNPSKFGVAYIDKDDSSKIKNIIEADLKKYEEGDDEVSSSILDDFDRGKYPELSDDEKAIIVVAIMDESIRPALANDGGGLEVIEVDGPIVRIRYQGACGGCPSSTGGTLRVIENHLKSQLDPEIKVHTYT